MLYQESEDKSKKLDKMYAAVNNKNMRMSKLYSTRGPATAYANKVNKYNIKWNKNEPPLTVQEYVLITKEEYEIYADKNY